MNLLFQVKLNEHPIEPLHYWFKQESGLVLLSPSSTGLSSLSLSSVISNLQEDLPSAMFQVDEVKLITFPYPLKYLGFIKEHNKKRLFRVYTCDSTPNFESGEDVEVTAVYRLSIPEPFLCQLKLKWDYPINLLSEPDKFCKSCTIFAQGGIGQNNIFESFFNDLELIDKFREFGKDFENDTSSEDRVDKFIRNEVKMGRNGIVDLNSLNGFGQVDRIREEKVAAVTGLMPRSSFDFTDKLWEILRFSRDYFEMKSSYLKVVTMIRQQKYYPWVADGNNTRLGSNLMRLKHLKVEDEDVRHSILTLCEDFSENIVDVCIELGIHKLKADFQHFLVSGKVCSYEQLEFLIRDNYRDLNRSIQNLNKLYKILQISLLLKTGGINVRTINKMMNPLLYHYQEKDGFMLLTHEIKENFEVPCLNSYKLETWEAVRREKDEDRELVTHYLWIDEKWWVFIEEIFCI